MTNILKKATFGLWIFLLIMMIAATIIEKLYGTTVSSTYFYGSPFFIGLWIATTLLSLLYIIKRHIIRNKIVYLLHLSFILIYREHLLHTSGEYKETYTFDKEKLQSLLSIKMTDKKPICHFLFH